MMFKGSLEVGKEYELNNGEVYLCAVGPGTKYILGGQWYYANGRYSDFTTDNPKSVRAPAVGTLAELDVKPGDVVEMVENYLNKFIGEVCCIGVDGCAISRSFGCYDQAFDVIFNRAWRIVSRAEHTAKPVVDTIVFHGCHTSGFNPAQRITDTHRLTFDVIDGEPTNPRFEAVRVIRNKL